jgi:hypothetical protein
LIVSELVVLCALFISTDISTVISKDISTDISKDISTDISNKKFALEV